MPTNHGSGLQKRRKLLPGEKVTVIEGPFQELRGTVIEQNGETVLLWLDRGLYARVHEIFLDRIESRW